MTDISFVIPVYNEADILARQLESIRQYVPAELDRQVIVVDNGSTDNSVQVAHAGGADIVLERSGTVAASRNAGASHATGEVIIFIDADVLLTDRWRDHIVAAIDALKSVPMTITGSTVSVPPGGNWIERSWFAPKQEAQRNYINTGHLIVIRASFDVLGGFREELVSGEDYEFSMRARQQGYRLYDNKQLRVIHHGYPRSLLQFARRERWHGEGDYQGWRAFTGSKIAIASQLCLAAALTAAGMAVASGNAVWLLAGLVPLTAISTVAAVTRWRPAAIADLPAVILLGHVYFSSRAAALFSNLARRLAG
jgi:glycosyltransferase involved in cell wall biosynthesis